MTWTEAGGPVGTTKRAVMTTGKLAMKIDGQCHCGYISYEAEIDPDRVAALRGRSKEGPSGRIAVLRGGANVARHQPLPSLRRGRKQAQ